jgi:hypothetical protein
MNDALDDPKRPDRRGRRPFGPGAGEFNMNQQLLRPATKNFSLDSAATP